MASPTMVVRKCPTCISLATFGEEYSTTTVCGVAVGASPSLGSPSICVACAAIQSSRSEKLMKPGPLTSGSAHMSATSSRAASSAATSRGGRPSRLPSGSATLAWKSANEDGRISGSASPKSGPNDATMASCTRCARTCCGSAIPQAYKGASTVTGGGGSGRRGRPTGPCRTAG